MSISCAKKSLAVAVILLFVSVSVIPSTGTVVEKKSTLPTLYDGDIFYVGGSGPGNYTTIQEAINNASDGDTVFVYEGIYHENPIVYKSINLIGENKHSNMIDGGGNVNADVVTITADGVILRGFYMVNSGYAWGDAGILIKSKNNIIEDNILFDNDAGVLVKDSEGPNTVNNCTFRMNDKGVYSEDSQNCIISNCNIQDSSMGVYLIGFDVYNSGNIISNCTFDDNSEAVQGLRARDNLVKDCEIISGGIYGIDFSFDCYNNTVKNCRINSVGTGVQFFDESHDNSIEDCVITDCYWAGVEFYLTNRDAKVINCTIEGTKNGFGLEFGNIIGCVISGCIFVDNSDGGILFVLACVNVVVSNCHFLGNKYAIYMDQSNILNKFYYNNFIYNEENFKIDLAVFLFNFYKYNYWSDWRGWGPYHVIGLLNWDFRPAKVPYDLPAV